MAVEEEEGAGVVGKREPDRAEHRRHGGVELGGGVEGLAHLVEEVEHRPAGELGVDLDHEAHQRRGGGGPAERLAHRVLDEQQRHPVQRRGGAQPVERRGPQTGEPGVHDGERHPLPGQVLELGEGLGEDQVVALGEERLDRAPADGRVVGREADGQGWGEDHAPRS